VTAGVHEVGDVVQDRGAGGGSLGGAEALLAEEAVDGLGGDGG
jgi:hypothetical protein